MTAFARLLHAEWTKFRTVRGWVTGTVAAAGLVVLVALLAGVSSDERGRPAVTVGPDGEPVSDTFSFLHQPLTGDGSVTAAVSEFTTRVAPDFQPGTVPWAKAGVLIKDGTRPGSPYAAIMVTGSHGVRMQNDYVNDTVGLAGPVSASDVRWLRLDRSGQTITGYDSTDGTHWTKVGTVNVTGLDSVVQVGLFVTSPDSERGFGTVPTVATAVFDDVRVRGDRLDGTWTGDEVGQGPGSPTPAGSFTGSAGGFTVTGTGDIAPAVRETLPGAGTVGEILTGTFAALIAVIVVGTLFITAEYRPDLLAVTLASSPRRRRVLVAKAVVLGAVTFAAGLVGAAIAVPLGERLARAHGVYLFPVTAAERFRVEVGTAALLATASVLALAVGTMFRRGAAAVTTLIAVMVLPRVLVAIPFLPAAVSDWLTRVTPAAAFALQQTLVRYHQVASSYTPYEGYYPLAPWTGFAVLACYTVVALVVAAVLLGRRYA